jgi:hypothetical protein
VDLDSDNDWKNGTVSTRAGREYTEFAWYVPKRFYMLESISLYKDFSKVTGFEVTFQPHPNLSGWPSET